MSDEPFSTKRILLLRKLTRAISTFLTNQLREYLDALGPQLRPRSVLGDYVESVKETVKGSEAAFKDVQIMYEKVGGPKKFHFAQELEKPLELNSSAVEIAPVEYAHVAKLGADSKTILITSPLRWAVNYEGYSIKRFEKVRADTTQTDSREIFEFYIHYIVLHVVLSHQPRVMKLLDTLHFSIGPGNRPELGGLPLTYISSKVSTIRPPDEVIIESTEVSGVNVFEEVVSVADLTKLSDPVRDKLLELMQQSGIS
jgi:hypothetical protein